MLAGLLASLAPNLALNGCPVQRKRAVATEVAADIASKEKKGRLELKSQDCGARRRRCITATTSRTVALESLANTRTLVTVARGRCQHDPPRNAERGERKIDLRAASEKAFNKS